MGKAMTTLRRLLWAGLALAAAQIPSIAAAVEGYTTAAVRLREGPSTDYPAIRRIHADSSVEIFGCIRGFTWCEIGWRGWEGWVSARNLEFYEGRRRYSLLEDGYRYDVPIVVFRFDDRGFDDDDDGWRYRDGDWQQRPRVVIRPGGDPRPRVDPPPNVAVDGWRPPVRRGNKLYDQFGNELPLTSDQYDRYGGP